MKVRLESIQYGTESFEVAVSVEDSQDFYVTFPTAESILNYRDNSVREKIASKSLKAFLGAGRTVGKNSGTIVNKPNLVGAIAKVSLLKYTDFLSLCQWEASINQNTTVAKMLAVGFGDSFRSIAYKQLGIQLSLEERQLWIAERLESKELFYELTEAIKTWKENRECSAPAHTYYSNTFDAINVGLFGKKSKQIREELGVSGLTRDHFGTKSLRRLTTVQESTARLLNSRKVEKPTEGVKTSLDFLSFPVADYRV